MQASALVYIKVLGDGKFQHQLSKFYSDEDIAAISERFAAVRVVSTEAKNDNGLSI